MPTNPTPEQNCRQIVNLLERNGIELWLEGYRLKARWTAHGQMPKGADGFIRQFKAEIVTHLQERELESGRAA